MLSPTSTAITVPQIHFSGKTFHYILEHGFGISQKGIRGSDVKSEGLVYSRVCQRSTSDDANRTTSFTNYSDISLQGSTHSSYYIHTETIPTGFPQIYKKFTTKEELILYCSSYNPALTTGWSLCSTTQLQTFFSTLQGCVNHIAPNLCSAFCTQISSTFVQTCC